MGLRRSGGNLAELNRELEEEGEQPQKGRIGFFAGFEDFGLLREVKSD